MQTNAVIVSVFVLMRRWCCLIDSEAFKVNLFHFFLNDVFFFCDQCENQGLLLDRAQNPVSSDWVAFKTFNE